MSEHHGTTDMTSIGPELGAGLARQRCGSEVTDYHLDKLTVVLTQHERPPGLRWMEDHLHGPPSS